MIKSLNDEYIELIKALPIERLIAEHGTALYLYNEKVVERQLALLKRHFDGYDIFYSFKSNPNKHICRTIKEQGHFADTASIGEVRLAKESGFESSEIVYSSPGKKRQEIEEALDNCMLVADSLPELKLINEICMEKGIVQEIGIRINPSFSLSGAALEVMSGFPSKFGIDEELIENKLEEIKALANIKIVGIQVYMGSQITDYNILCENFKNIHFLALKCKTEFGFELQYIDFGGGFGVRHSEEEAELDIEKAGDFARSLIKLPEFIELRGVRRIIESGRFIVANSGMYVSQVLDIKESRGKRYAILDGGMNTFFRPVFIKENKYPAYVVSKLGLERSEKITLAGIMCTPIDIFEEDVMLPHIEKGDILAFLNTGAYGYSMSLTKFISHEEAKEIYIKKDGRILL